MRHLGSRRAPPSERIVIVKVLLRRRLVRSVLHHDVSIPIRTGKATRLGSRERPAVGRGETSRVVMRGAWEWAAPRIQRTHSGSFEPPV